MLGFAEQVLSILTRLWLVTPCPQLLFFAASAADVVARVLCANYSHKDFSDLLHLLLVLRSL